MTLVDAPPVGDLEPLTVPHGPWCSPSTHGRYGRCMTELALENHVEDALRARYPRMTVQRQPIWPGVGRPDLVTITKYEDLTMVSVLELKAVPVNTTAVRQLWRYVEAMEDIAEQASVPTIVTGILVGFRFRPMDLPEWAIRWPIQVEG